MSNSLPFWNGQPVTAPIYPHMGDIQQININAAMDRHHQCYSGGTGAGHGLMLGMGDLRYMSCPPMPTNSFYQSQVQYGPCIGSVEAFCVCNGINASTQGGGYFL